MHCNHTMNDTDKRHALYVIGSLGLAAAVVCVLAVTLLLAFKLHNHFAHRLALYQALAAFCFGVILVLQSITLKNPKGDWQNGGCMALGFFLLYFTWLQLLFTSWVVLHLFCLSVLYKSTRRFEVLLIMFIVTFPLLFIWVPFIEYGDGNESAYGTAGAWCWIKSWKNNCIEDKFMEGISEQFGIFFVPAAILSVADSIAIVAIFSRLLCCRPNREQETLVARAKRVRALAELLPLLIYPLIFCFLLIPSLIDRIYGAVSDNYSVYTLMVAAAIVPLQPLLVGIMSFIYVCVLKFKHRIFRKRRPSHRTCTFVTERPTNYIFADGDSYSYTRYDTQAICPNESEVDRSVLVSSREEAGIQVLKPYAAILM